MTIEVNKRIVRRFIEEVVNTGEVGNIEEFIAPEYSEIHDGRRCEVGLKGAKEHVLGVRATYPDLILTVDRQIAEGEWVASCITARGTHQGEWMGIRPTGKSVMFTGVNVDRVVAGRIMEHGGAANMLGPLLETGAVKVTGT